MTKKIIVEWFAENEDVFNDCIEELDSYNGYLGDDRYYCMEEMQDLYCGVDPFEILQRAFFGHDEDTWHTDAHGDKEYGAFNPNREYFHFNGYGNLVSSDWKDYTDHLDEYFIDELIENRSSLYCIDENQELSAMFDALEEEQEVPNA